ncbi:hypothetical protein EDD90_3279 [Streptomyces sp. Ag109_O5-1]|uniref:hypothetical protein n=1 Tax=Streptomyces sp. Ag109_O5-1 TaxID=1938851 RepID=UPI000F51196C|nr:hypothetical protein [Streptomyces sp. Ag109_O5-1]RPE40243.1 hypothetical protein EDD90_3279 [Streptomyces sp. Ag109_O5-1]
MGTNYYVHTPACANACEHCSASEQLHLGKSSMGWRFLFQAEPDWPREQAYSLWLERAKSGEIRDEYGRATTLDELLAFVQKKQDGRSHVGIRPQLSSALYASMREADFDCGGYDFCDRYFS